MVASLRCLVSISLIVGFAIGAISPASAGKGKTVTLAMSLTPLSAPVIIAAEQGYFAKHGLDVVIKDYVGGYRAIKAVFEGQADLATASEAVVMFNSFRRADFAIVCTFVSSDNDVKIVTRKDTGIASVQDLAGRRVGTVTGASAQFFLDETLFLAGIDSSRVEVVHVNPEDSPASLASGDIDAMVVWEPLIYRIRQKLGAQAVLVPHAKVYTETFNLLALREFANQRPGALDGIVRALIEATGFIEANRERAQGIVAKRIGNDIALLKSVWPDFDFAVSLHQWLLTTLEAQARWALENRLVPGGAIPNYLEFLHLKTLAKIDPSAVTVYR